MKKSISGWVWFLFCVFISCWVGTFIGSYMNSQNAIAACDRTGKAAHDITMAYNEEPQNIGDGVDWTIKTEARIARNWVLVIANSEDCFD